MADYTEVYEEAFTSGAINAGASENYLSGQTAKQQISLNGQSFNALEIVNSSGQLLYIDLDGLVSRRRYLFANASIVISPEDGIFFNTLKITNSSGTTGTNASEIQGVARISKKVLTPVIQYSSKQQYIRKG